MHGLSHESCTPGSASMTGTKAPQNTPLKHLIALLLQARWPPRAPHPLRLRLPFCLPSSSPSPLLLYSPSCAQQVCAPFVYFLDFHPTALALPYYPSFLHVIHPSTKSFFSSLTMLLSLPPSANHPLPSHQPLPAPPYPQGMIY